MNDSFGIESRGSTFCRNVVESRLWWFGCVWQRLVNFTVRRVYLIFNLEISFYSCRSHL